MNNRDISDLKDNRCGSRKKKNEEEEEEEGTSLCRAVQIRRTPGLLVDNNGRELCGSEHRLMSVF